MINITLRQLEAFLAVASLQSFTAAGKSMNITQSAVSGLIKELEAQTGVSLFDRTSRAVFLSPDGETFLPVAHKALQEFELAGRYAKELKDRRSGLIRLVGAPLIACTLLPVYMAEFARAAPDIRIELVDEPMSRVQRRVLDGDASLGFGPERTLEPDITARALFHTPVSMVCRPDHHLIRKRVTWNMLKQEPLIVVGRESIAKISSDVGGRGTFRIAHVVNQMPTACALAAAGEGVVVAGPFSMLLARGYGLAVVPIFEPVLNRGMMLYTHRNRPLSAIDAMFVSFLDAHVAKNNPDLTADRTLSGMVGPLPVRGPESPKTVP